MRAVLQTHALDDDPGGQKERSREGGEQSTLGLWFAVVGARVQVHEPVGDGAGGELAEDGADGGGEADGEANAYNILGWSVGDYQYL